VDDYGFDWSPAKARLNARKHGVTFDEAQTVFADDDALLVEDAAHSDGEQRFHLLGTSAQLRILVVVHAYREPSGIIRLISARKATPSERAQYGTR
jgi:uncharacterized protein